MTARAPTLKGCQEPLASSYDVGLFDLDGVLNVGDDPVAHAADALAAAREQGLRPAYVTNNALRTPDEVAARLQRLGVPAEVGEVVTSAQAAARVLKELLPTQARVLVAGGEGLRAALRAAGLEPVAGADDDPVAIVTGHDPEQTWKRLAEANLALLRGLPWVASNVDASIPDKRGRLPGAGAIVALLTTGSGRTPDTIAGKPHPALHQESMARTGATHPLVIGDRLDTDIEGANAAGVDSLLVFTGVTDPADALRAAPAQRPSYLARDLRGLLTPHPEPRVADGHIEVGTSKARLHDGVLEVEGADPADCWRAAAACAWREADAGREFREVRGLPDVR